MKAKLERPVTFFERQWPWLLVAFFVLGLLVSIVAASATGLLEQLDQLRFGPNLRGYTAAGLLMGFFSLFFVLLTLWYSVRKRRSTRGASMMAWLWAHVYLGLLALVAAVLHAGFGLVSFSMSSGKVLFILFAIIVISGVVWRLAYAVVPPKAAATVLNYSKDGAMHRAEEVLLEIEKLTAGKSAALQQIKDRVLAGDPPPHEIHQMAAMLGPDERAILDDLVQLGASRQRALRRPPLQAAFTRRLQMWRVLHVPLAFVFLFALGVHVVGAFDVPRKLVPVGVATQGPLAAYRTSEECKDCHATIYAQWAESMHAHALVSPLTILQNNLDMRHTLAKTASPDPRRMCINCHGPAIAAVVPGDTLPLGNDRQREGVECVSCHQLPDAVTPGGGALASLYQDNLIRGDRYFGRLESPVGNAFHRSEKSKLFDEPEKLCATCHNVNYDKNGDGRIVKGVDLVLQTTFDEYREYQQTGGRATCMTCHMPVVPKLTDVADGAQVPFTEDYAPPDRKLHDHSFVGVDYPLDTVAKKDPQKPRRAALLASAAGFSLEQARVDGDKLVVRLTIENTTGHNLPTGFAFARQMWIELVAKEAGQPIFASGVIAKPADDLCDAATFGDTTNPLRSFVVGCTEVDPQLVNIQLKLVDKIAALADANGQPVLDEGGEHVLIQSKEAKGETYLQALTGGAVARPRPSDKASLAPLRPGGKRTYQYTIPLARTVKAGSVSARLLFRNLPPYWVRAMAAEQKPHEEPRIEPLIANIQTVEMAKVEGSFTR
jgi:nucleotide-binding universal stress UspA family protein